MAAWKEAPEVKDIALGLIADHHAHLGPFTGQMRFIFRDEAAKSKGKRIAGKAHKITGMAAYLAESTKDKPRIETIPAHDVEGKVIPARQVEAWDAPEFFLVEIAYDIWGRLEEWQRIALVDHELYHFTIDFKEDGSLALAIRAHDLEEFLEVLVRYGRWDSDLDDFADAMQMRLDLEQGPAGTDPSKEEIERVLRKLGRHEPGTRNFTESAAGAVRKMAEDVVDGEEVTSMSIYTPDGKGFTASRSEDGDLKVESYRPEGGE